jgi:outer membrane protein assembly factor BamB
MSFHLNLRFVRMALLALLLMFSIGTALPAQKPAEPDWPQFRGPDGQGHSTARNLPLTWNETENVRWKIAVPGLGWSSPVIRGDQIWLTTAVDAGRSLRALCLDRMNGKVLHDVEVFANNTPVQLTPPNSHASPTPILEGDRLYVHFGTYGTACLTTDGKILWKTKLKYTSYYGPSSTPVLFEDLLIATCQGSDVHYTAALDKRTGAERWKQSHEGRNSEATPLVIRTSKGDQLVCNLAERVVAYDPKTGKELWSVEQGDNYAQVPRPVSGHGLVFVCGGYFSPVLHAIRPDGRGDITKTHVVWSTHKAVPQNPSPLLVGDELYLVTDKGIASCLDARTGKLHWQERLGGGFYASPTYADGRIYFLAQEGVMTVVAAGTTYRRLAVNRLEGRTLASPAMVGRAIYLRTDKHLYCLEKT